MDNAVLVALGGSLGAGLRYHLYRIHPRREIPLGTFAANMLGCFLMPFFLMAGRETYLSFSFGFTGSLTTFSTLIYESFRLAERGNFKLSIGNVILNLLFGMMAFTLGKIIAGGLL